MRNNRSRRFFFCMQECSPSTSATERPRFGGLGGDLERKLKPISGSGGAKKGNNLWFISCAGMSNSDKWFGRSDVGLDDACLWSARIILRCPASCVVYK